MTCPASSSLFGIPATGAVTGVERRGPVDKGGLTPPPAPELARKRLQLLCFSGAAAFVLLGAAVALMTEAAAMMLVILPVLLCVIAGLGAGLEKPSLRQRMILWSVTLTVLVTAGIQMMPHEPEGLMKAVRDAGYIASAAAVVLTGLCAVLPPYGGRKAGAGDALLRAASVAFCFLTTVTSYMAVYFICTPHGH